MSENKSICKVYSNGLNKAGEIVVRERTVEFDFGGIKYEAEVKIITESSPQFIRTLYSPSNIDKSSTGKAISKTIIVEN